MFPTWLKILNGAAIPSIIAGIVALALLKRRRDGTQDSQKEKPWFGIISITAPLIAAGSLAIFGSMTRSSLGLFVMAETPLLIGVLSAVIAGVRHERYWPLWLFGLVLNPGVGIVIYLFIVFGSGSNC